MPTSIRDDAPPDTEPRSARRRDRDVRGGLVAAAIELAREGGPNAVVLRAATRRVGVAPNAAYRHFADRDELLNAVCVEAMRLLASQMEQEIARISAHDDPRAAAAARLRAVGSGYLDFADDEPGLFRTAFAVPDHLEYAMDPAATAESGRTPFELLGDALDMAVDAGLLPAERRPTAQFIAWATVHGFATLRQQGPLRQLPSGSAAAIREALLDGIQRAI